MIHHHNYKKKVLWQILETFSHYQQVSFAFYCAKDVEPFTNDQRVIDCNQVLQRWLKGDQTVDLEIARNNAWNAWNAVNSASYAASYAAYYAISAAYYAISAAYYAANAARAAANANAKSYNLYPNSNKQIAIARKQFFKEYKQIAQNWLSYWTIPNFPKESDFPIFDFLIDMNLISYLLPKKRKYYHLNLNGFDIKHESEAELLKEIDTIHIKTILRRIINNAET